MLLAIVVGSGIMAERLSGGNVALALLANTLATGAGLVALILPFGPVSGAHFNPAVTIADASQGGVEDWRRTVEMWRGFGASHLSVGTTGVGGVDAHIARLRAVRAVLEAT